MAVQDLTQQGKAGKWRKSGSVVEVQPFNSYLIRMHGSREVTKRNRRHLRKIEPFSPLIPDLSIQHQSVSLPPTTRSKSAPEHQTLPHQSLDPPLPEAPAAPPLPLPNPSVLSRHESKNMSCPKPPTAEIHRHKAAASPGDTNLLKKLKEMETQGQHLAIHSSQASTIPSIKHCLV